VIRRRSLVVLLLTALAAALTGFAPTAGRAATSTASTTTCASPGRVSVGSRLFGIVRPSGPVSQANCPVQGAAVPAVGAELAYRGSPPLTFHGGPVMSTDPLGGQVTVTPIFWAPSGYTFPSSYRTVLGNFFTDAAAASGTTGNVFSSLAQYTDSAGNHIRYKLAVGSAVSDTQAFPTGGCTADTGSVYGDNSGYATCLTDAQVSAEATRLVNAQGLTSDLAHLYVIFLPKSVESCFTANNGAQGGPCTINSHAGSSGGYCAYHSFLDSSSLIYANMPFPVYNSATGYTCSPEFTAGIQTPNGNTDADVEVSPLSHEMSEAISDPKLNAWLDSIGNEDGDDCAYIYGGGFGGSAGAYYNQTMGARHYFVQEEFSNEDFAVSSAGACIQREETPTAAFTVGTLTPLVNLPVGFDGSGSSDKGGTGSLSYKWDFGDGSLLGIGKLPLHTFLSGGTFTVKLTVTDADGWTASVSHPVTIGTGPGAPGAPTAVKATAGNSSATVTWTAPANNGSTISSYTVTGTDATVPARGGQQATVTGTPPATSATVTGLTNGDSYTFVVTATNGNGPGQASSPSNAVTPILPLGPNLVKNPSFEKNLTGWGSLNGKVTRIKPGAGKGAPQGGVYAAHVVWAKNVLFTLGDSVNAALQHPTLLNAVTGTQYQSSVWVRASGTSTGKPLKLILRERNPANQIVHDTFVQITLSKTWQKVLVQATVLTTGDSLGIAVEQDNAVTGNAFDADIVWLRKMG
jgi:PKD repeat protein